jgi:hypothetical protein
VRIASQCAKRAIHSSNLVLRIKYGSVPLHPLAVHAQRPPIPCLPSVPKEAGNGVATGQLSQAQVPFKRSYYYIVVSQYTYVDLI